MDLNKNEPQAGDEQNNHPEIVSAETGKSNNKKRKLFFTLGSSLMVLAVAGMTYALLFTIMPKKTLQNSPQKIETANTIDSDIQQVIEEEHSTTDQLYSAESQTVEEDANSTKSLEENYGL